MEYWGDVTIMREVVKGKDTLSNKTVAMFG